MQLGLRKKESEALCLNHHHSPTLMIFLSQSLLEKLEFAVSIVCHNDLKQKLTFCCNENSKKRLLNGDNGSHKYKVSSDVTASQRKLNIVVIFFQKRGGDIRLVFVIHLIKRAMRISSVTSGTGEYK